MRNKGRDLVLLIVLVSIILVPYLNVIPVKANPLTTVTIELQEEEAYVDVSPESSGIVEITGEITCTKYGPDQVSVHLEAESESNGASVIPANLVYAGASGSIQTDTINVTTRVPQCTPCTETFTLTVGGYYEQGGMQYDIVPESATIIVDQYYGVGVFVKEEELLVKSGEDAEIEFRIHNTGNGNDIFLVDFENRKDLKDDGFELPRIDEFPLPQMANESIKLEIGVPEGVLGEYLVQISITSMKSEEGELPIEYILEVKLNVEARSIGEHIGTILTSPLTIGIIVIVILVVIVLKLKGRRELSSAID